MAKTWLIIKHEYLTNIKRRSFLFGAFGVPIITILLMTVVFGLVINNETDVDPSRHGWLRRSSPAC